MNETPRPILPFYPFLIGLYAIIFLSAVNIGQFAGDDIIFPAIITLSISLVVFLASLLLLRKLHKAALFSVWVLVIIFLYGQFFSLIDGKTIAGLTVVRHRILLPLLAILTLVIFYFIWKTRMNFHNLSVLLNIVMVVMIVTAGVPILTYTARFGLIDGGAFASTLGSGTVKINGPDIYYIILDSYQRDDVLLSQFQYDNSAFTNELRKLGFYIPKCTFSNYLTTTPALSSTLNMDYLENMGFSDKALVDTFDPALSKMVVNSKVLVEFKGMGYKLVANRGYFPPLDLQNADYYYNYEQKEQHKNLLSIHNFERLYMRTTILRPVIEAYEVNPKSLSFLPTWITGSTTESGIVFLHDRQWYLETGYTFSILPKVPDLPGPKFVYAHIYATHPPYVFDQQGNYTPQEIHQNPEGYIPVVQYTNQQVLNIVKTILEKSKAKPVIIIQGDHGVIHFAGPNHNKILNAYYFPDGDYSRLYDTITPVNTFRVVLDQFFHRSYPLIKDTVLVKDKTSENNESTVRRLPASCDLK